MLNAVSYLLIAIIDLPVDESLPFELFLVLYLNVFFSNFHHRFVGY